MLSKSACCVSLIVGKGEMKVVMGKLIKTALLTHQHKAARHKHTRSLPTTRTHIASCSLVFPIFFGGANSLYYFIMAPMRGDGTDVPSFLVGVVRPSWLDADQSGPKW